MSAVLHRCPICKRSETVGCTMTAGPCYEWIVGCVTCMRIDAHFRAPTRERAADEWNQFAQPHPPTCAHCGTPWEMHGCELSPKVTP